MNRIVSDILSWAKSSPSKIAVIDASTSLTYEELVSLSSKLALHLYDIGIRRGSLVGLFFSQCYQLPVAVLATWMLGAIYIPIDPIYPSDRVMSIMSSVSLSAVLTATNFLPFSSHLSIPIVNVDSIAAANANVSDDFPHVEMDKDDLAYIIFTSGTTGKPKGVEIAIGGLINLLDSFKRLLNVTTHDVLLSVTPIAFDIFALELLLPLICGATCIFTNRSVVSDPSLMLNCLANNKVTLLQAVPSVYQLLTSEPWPSSIVLRHLLCGGEAWNEKLAKKIHEKMPPHCLLWNVYGPTETTIWSSITPVDKEGSIFLAPSVDHTLFTFIDPGCSEGELYIGGSGIAKGYHRDPLLTQERFIELDGLRFYKTGDIVRKIGDEKWVFVGREDQQVKIRGFRVELGDIEHALMKSFSISLVIVLYDHFQSQSEKTLVACIISEDKHTNQAFRNGLKEKIPMYMIPQFFMFFDQFPLTPNSKIDRKSLANQVKSRFEARAYRNTPSENLSLLHKA